MKKTLPTILVTVVVTALIFVIYFRVRDRKADETVAPHPMEEMQMPGMPGTTSSGSISTAFNPDIKIEPVDGRVTIASLYADPTGFDGKETIVNGQVTKVVRAVMGKNWVHIQDGTQHDGKFDLTITTQDEVEVNDVVVFKGTIAKDKDFTAGYFYEVILEDGALQK